MMMNFWLFDVVVLLLLLRLFDAIQTLNSDNFNVSVVETSSGMVRDGLCNFDGLINWDQLEESGMRIHLKHELFETRKLLLGVRYQVHISSSSKIVDELVVESSIKSEFHGTNGYSGECGESTYSFRGGFTELMFNWTGIRDEKEQRTVTFRINFKFEDNPRIFRTLLELAKTADCQLYLHPKTGSISNTNLPIGTSDCQIWFPISANNEGIVVELTRFNVPCSKGYLHFATVNRTVLHLHGPMFNKLCGKLEEVAQLDRQVYFPEISKTWPFLHVHNSPLFTITYRLVDYCFNITYLDKEGAIDLQPSANLQCTFRIYLPYGNRVVLKLLIGNRTNHYNKSSTTKTTFNLQDFKSTKQPICNGLLTQLNDGSFHWYHCTKHNDETQQLEIVSNENKIVLKINFNSTISLRFHMWYHAEPIESLIGTCEFGWIAIRNFCVAILDVFKLTWSEAEADCVGRGGHLVSIRSEGDHQRVNEMLLNSPRYRDGNAYWIGATDQMHEGDYRWSDGLSFSYTNWFSGWPQHQHYNRQPNDDGLSEQDCVEMRRMFALPSATISLTPNFMWNDRDCSTMNHYICEKLHNDEPLEETSSLDCNHTVQLSRQTPRKSMSSPGFPRRYPDNADCNTKIEAPPGYRIILDFDELVIEAEPNCSYDYLEIIEPFNNVTHKKLCGDWSSKLKLLRYVSNSSKLNLRFSSDYSHHYGGFKARVSMENALQCGDERQQMFNEACYLVVNYPIVTWTTAQQICRGMKAWLASVSSAEEGRFISNTIRKNPDYRTSALYWLGAKADPSGNFKWIDGSGMEEFQGWLPGVDNLHHHHHHHDLKCMGLQYKPSVNSLFPSGLYWKSENCNQVGGYVCKRKQNFPGKTADLNKTINGSAGSLTSPNYPESYYNNLNFVIHLLGPDRSRLKIRFERIDLEQQPECLYDYVELRSVSRSNKVLDEDSRRFCGSHTTEMDRFDFVSRTNELELMFHSDYSVTGTGFSLSWSAVDVSSCPTQTLTAQQGRIDSPNYPDFLLSHLDCTITIRAPAGKRIYLEFTDIDLDSFNKTTMNPDDVRLELQLGKKVEGFQPFQVADLLTEGNFLALDETLKIRLQTGSVPRGRGFRASYRMVEDNAKEEKVIQLEANTTGLLFHVNYPQECPINLDFLQRFISPPASVISLELHGVKLTNSDCELGLASVEVFDKYSGTTWKLCHNPPTSLVDNDEDTTIHIKSFLHFLQLRQKTSTFGNNNNILNGTLRVIHDPDYTRKLIEYTAGDEVQWCKPNPCLNEGKCLKQKGRNICQCIGHFTGLFCGITQCDLDPCVFGNCELTNTSYKCHCKPNYVGPTCEQKRRPCEGNPCESRGSCIEKGNGFHCRCHAWWEGQRCEKRMMHIPYKPLSERMLHEPFWLGLLTVFVVMAVIGLVWCAKRHFPEKIEKLLAEDDSRNRIHSLRSTSVREQLAAASSAASASGLIAATPSPGQTPSNRSIFGRLGIRKPSILSLTSPHAGGSSSAGGSLVGGSGGYSPATARTFSLDDLLKPSQRRSPSPKKKRTNSTPIKKNVADKKQILQQLVSPQSTKVAKRVSLGELIQMTDHRKSGIQSAPAGIVKETKFSADPALAALNDPKLEKKVTFARLLNRVSAEMSSGSDLDQTRFRPASTPPSPSGIIRSSPNSTSSNQGSVTSSDLAINASIQDMLMRRSPIGQKPASADSILAMFRNFSTMSANLGSSLIKLTPSTTPTASSPHDDLVGDDESTSSPISFSSGPPEESPNLQPSTIIEVPVLDPLSAHRASCSGANLLHPPTILLEIPSTISNNKCLSPIRELPTPLPSPARTPVVMRRSQSSITRSTMLSNSSQDSGGGGDDDDDKMSVELPNISGSGSDDDDEDMRCGDIPIDPQAEDGLIFEEAAAMQQCALYRTKGRTPLVIPTLTVQTPSPTRKTPTFNIVPGSPPPHRFFPSSLHDDGGLPFPTIKSSRRMIKDLDKPTSLDLPSAPPQITITCNMSEAESDVDSISPAGKLGVATAGMTYLSPFSMVNRGDQHASESNLSSSGYSSMASPGPSRCGSSNPLCDVDDHACLRRQSLTPVLRPSSTNSILEESSTKQDEQQRRTRSDSETLSDDPLVESNDEGIGTDHIDEKIDDGEVKSAKELQVFIDTISVDTLLLELPSKELSKHSLQLPSILVDGEKYLSPMSSRSESPLSDKVGLSRFSPMFYGKNKDLLPFTDSDGLYDFPSTDKVNVSSKKLGRRREKRQIRSKTPSPTKQGAVTWQLDVPNGKKEGFFFKVPSPRKLSPNRRLARTQVVSSSSSSESLTCTEVVRHSTSTPDSTRWANVDEEATSPMLSKSVEFARKPNRYQKVSKLRAISNQIRFLRRLEQTLKKKERTWDPNTSESDDNNPRGVTSPLLQKNAKVEIKKSNSIGKLYSYSAAARANKPKPTTKGWMKELKHGSSE